MSFDQTIYKKKINIDVKLDGYQSSDKGNEIPVLEFVKFGRK